MKGQLSASSDLTLMWLLVGRSTQRVMWLRIGRSVKKVDGRSAADARLFYLLQNSTYKDDPVITFVSHGPMMRVTCQTNIFPLLYSLNRKTAVFKMILMSRRLKSDSRRLPVEIYCSVWTILLFQCDRYTRAVLATPSCSSLA